jgi:hypothetical protein
MMALYEKNKGEADAQLKGRKVTVRDVIDHIDGRTITLRNRLRDKDSVACDSTTPVLKDSLKPGLLVEATGVVKGRGLLGNITLADCTVASVPVPQGQDQPSATVQQAESSITQLPPSSAQERSPSPDASPALPISGNSSPQGTPEEAIGNGDHPPQAESVSVAELMAAYGRDKGAADQKFKGLRFRVRDYILEFQHSSLVLGRTGKGQDVVRCPLEPADAEKWRHLTSGVLVTVEGFGRGRGLRGNVTLDACQIVDGPQPAAISSLASEGKKSEIKTGPLLIGGLVVLNCVLLAWWIWNRFFRARCPKCRSLKFATVDHEKIHEWVGTKTVTNTTTANHETRMYGSAPDPSGALRNTGRTTMVSKQQIPVTKVKYRDVVECEICKHRWAEVYTRELS